MISAQKLLDERVHILLNDDQDFLEPTLTTNVVIILMEEYARLKCEELLMNLENNKLL